MKCYDFTHGKSLVRSYSSSYNSTLVNSEVLLPFYNCMEKPRSTKLKSLTIIVSFIFGPLVLYLMFFLNVTKDMENFGQKFQLLLRYGIQCNKIFLSMTHAILQLSWNSFECFPHFDSVPWFD